MGGTFYYMCSVLDGYSRYIVHWELRESMKEEDPSVRVIAISGVTAKKLNEASRSGAHAILTKPVDPEELLDEVQKALASSGS